MQIWHCCRTVVDDCLVDVVPSAFFLMLLHVQKRTNDETYQQKRLAHFIIIVELLKVHPGFKHSVFINNLRLYF